MFSMGWGSLSHQKVKCAICSHEQTLFVDRETFTCRRCKKTLPRRLAVPATR
jgi:ribosomal protein S27E